MKRQRTDTVSGEIEAFGNAKDVPIPEHIELDPTARLQWDLVTRSKSADLWTENDLELAAEICIARSQKNRIRRQMALLETDYDKPFDRLRGLAEGEKQVDALVKREERLTRLLQIHPAATVGKARESVKKNTATRQARETINAADDLIAQPIH